MSSPPPYGYPPPALPATPDRQQVEQAEAQGQYAVEVERQRGYNERARLILEHGQRMQDEVTRLVLSEADHSRRMIEGMSAAEDRAIEAVISHLIAGATAEQGQDLTPAELAEMYEAARRAAGG